MKINNFKPYIAGNELTYIKTIIDGGLGMSGDGSFTKKVHTLLEKKYGTKKALLTTSGTTALEFAVRLLNLSPGDEVIVPSFTFSSTANAVLVSFGLKLIFADVVKDTLNIDPDDIERKITKKTKAIIVVHYAGVACDMDRIMKIAKKHKIKVIEDAAQAIEAKYKDKYLGTIGDFGCFSFHDTKNITCGEGGALFINTNNKKTIERAEIIREKGTNRSKFFRGEVDKYTWVDIGSSYLPSDILAAFLLAQLENAESITKLRLSAFNFYKTELNSLEKNGHIKLPTVPSYAKHNGHIFYVIFGNATERDFVMNYMRQKGVSAPFHYVPLHSSPLGQKLGYVAQDFPVTEQLSECLIRLPMYASLTREEQDYVIKTLKEGIREYLQTEIKVTVGISAYNEERNIKKILQQVIQQNQNNWTLKEIIVVSDGSTDKTAFIANSLKEKKVQVFDFSSRAGKSARLNQIFQKATGEIIVLLDADVELEGKDTLSSLISEFEGSEKLSLVGGNPRPFKPSTFFEKAVYSTFTVLDKSRNFVKNGNNIYGCSGQIMALRTKFAKTLNIPEGLISDDDYIYFSCLKQNLKFRYCKNAVAYYKLPKNLIDYSRQIFRSDPDSATRNVEKYFGSIVKSEYERPFPLYLAAVFTALRTNPLGAMLMILIRVLSKPVGPVISSHYKLSWFTATSTK